MDPDQQLRNLRDFLLVYNRMTEVCFQRCTSNFNYRNLTMDEESCVDNCAGKLIRSNHRLMGTYVQLMPRMVQRRMEELESKAVENAKAAEAAAIGSTATSEASPAFQTSINSPPSGTDVIPQLQSSVLKSEGLDILADTTATGVKLSPATPTPTTETVFNEAPRTAGSPQSSISKFQSDSSSSEAASLSEKVSTAATTES